MKICKIKNMNKTVDFLFRIILFKNILVQNSMSSDKKPKTQSLIRNRQDTLQIPAVPKLLRPIATP